MSRLAVALHFQLQALSDLELHFLKSAGRRLCRYRIGHGLPVAAKRIGVDDPRSIAKSANCQRRASLLQCRRHEETHCTIASFGMKPDIRLSGSSPILCAIASTMIGGPDRLRGGLLRA
jgi:hypothetical protein